MKKGGKRGSRNRKKGDVAVFIRTCRAECYLHHPGACLASQALSFESAQPLFALSEQRARVHLLFATPLGLAASLRPDGFVSGAVSFVRRTLARSVFLGFQIGVPRCRPRCSAAVCWFLLRGRELRPEDACQKRFLGFQIGVPMCKSVYA